MKRIFCCLLLFSFLYQSNAQSRNETIQWLFSKLHPLIGVRTRSGFQDRSNNWWYNYWTLSIGFDGSDSANLYVLISNKLLTTSESEDDNNYSSCFFSLNKLSRVEFTSFVSGETVDRPVFIFHTFGQDISITKNHEFKPNGYTSSVIVPIDVTSEDNLGARLKKAFDHLIALNQPKQAF